MSLSGDGGKQKAPAVKLEPSPDHLEAGRYLFRGFNPDAEAELGRVGLQAHRQALIKSAGVAGTPYQIMAMA